MRGGSVLPELFPELGLEAMAAAPRQLEIHQLADFVPDDTHLGVGGVLLERVPVSAVAAIAGAERRGLIVSSFLASLDMEMLVAAGCVRRARTGYVGLDRFGPAPVFRAAVADSAVEVEAHSELTFTSGLAAAACGVPFLPTRGALGSEVATDLGLLTIDDPYGGGPVLTVPATPLDVAVIHTEAVDIRGTVAMPSVPSFLWDADANLARAAGVVIVSAERIVDRIDGPSLLTGFDVDAIVHAPGGAAPGALPGFYAADDAWFTAHVGAHDPEAHARRLISQALKR